MSLRLRDKISIFFVAVILALVTTSFYAVNQRVESSLREMLRGQLKENNQVFQTLQQFTLKQIQGKCDLASRQNRLLAVLHAMRREPLETKVKNVQAVVPAVARDLGASLFLVYDGEGKLLFPEALRGRPELERLPAVADAFGQQRGQQQVLESGGSLYLAAATPILYKDQGADRVELLGAVLVAQPLAPLARDVQQIAGGETNVAISAGGKLLASTWQPTGDDPFAVVLSEQASEYERVQQGKRRQALIELPIRGERHVALVIPIHQRLDRPRAGAPAAGALTLVRSLDRALEAQMAQIRKRLIVIGLVAIFLTVLLNMAFARSITRPLSRLTDGMDEVARGNLKVNVPVTSRDEVGLLTRSFNEMVVGLSHKEKLSRMVSAAAARQVEASSGDSLQLGGVHERVTVFFSDIRNFTPMTERLGAAEIVALLNRWFAVAAQVIADHGGDIDKFIGDAIMVVFRDDSGPLRAVRCAVELQRQVVSFNEQSARDGRPEIAIGVGIATGEVVAGNVGTPQRLEYTVLGDTVNVAARLESESKVGRFLQVMLDPETYAQVAQQVEAVALDGTQLKGKSGPMTVYEVKGLRQEG